MKSQIQNPEGELDLKADKPEGQDTLTPSPCSRPSHTPGSVSGGSHPPLTPTQPPSQPSGPENVKAGSHSTQLLDEPSTDLSASSSCKISGTPTPGGAALRALAGKAEDNPSQPSRDPHQLQTPGSGCGDEEELEWAPAPMDQPSPWSRSSADLIKDLTLAFQVSYEELFGPAGKSSRRPQ